MPQQVWSCWAMRILSLRDDWHEETKTGPPLPSYSIILAFVWVLPVLAYWAVDLLLTRRRRTLFSARQSVHRKGSKLAHGRRLSKEIFSRGEQSFTVMLASLEHSLPHLSKARATAGGLGKVVDLIARKHPTDILLVHPMLEEVPGQVEYGEAVAEEPSLRLVVEGVRHDVQVFRYAGQSHGPRVEFLMFLRFSFFCFKCFFFF